MFFIMGITEGRKDFDFHQMVICDMCGAYGQFRVFMTYTVLSLFFIPCLKWNKRYYVQSTCCNSIYELNPEVGKQIARGENVQIQPMDLRLIQSGNAVGYRKNCHNCGYETTEDFEFCPKCGGRF